jgi:V8-like Glu-specific endopeptidase
MKRSVTGLFILSVALTLVAASALAGPLGFTPRSKAMEPATEEFDRGAWIMEMDRLNGRLQAEHVALGLDRTLEVPVDPAIVEEIVRGRADERKLRVGAEAEISVDVSFADLDLANLPRRGMLRDVGAIRPTHDGGFVWSASVRSPDAAALRIHIADMNFPEGSELYVWTRDGMAFGPYTGNGPNGNGEFWTNSVQGDEVVLQIRHRGGEAPSFRIAGVGHITSKWNMSATLNPMSTKTCSMNADCVRSAACGTSAAVADAEDAVAHMLFVSGAYYYICSGGLVADSDGSSQIPYFLTANHCISKGREANSLQTYFFFKDSSCQLGTCPTRGAANTNGASIVSSNRTSDYTLLRLSQNAPGGAAFLGWSTEPVAFANNTPLYRISHPQGAPQSYSEHTVDTEKGTCQSWPRGNWIYSTDTYGATEGGSSGSPVVNGSGQIVGQLSGA